MTVSIPTDRTIEEVLYRGYRDLRELGKRSPGVSFERDAMRELGLLDEEEGVADGHQIQVTIFEDGIVLMDFQLDRTHPADKQK